MTIKCFWGIFPLDYELVKTQDINYKMFKSAAHLLSQVTQKGNCIQSNLSHIIFGEFSFALNVFLQCFS